MNVLKPALKTTVKTLLCKEISQREIQRKTGIDRKTIRRYARSYDSEAAQETESSKSPTRQDVATGSGNEPVQNPCPFGKHARMIGGRMGLHKKSDPKNHFRLDKSSRICPAQNE